MSGLNVFFFFLHCDIIFMPIKHMTPHILIRIIQLTKTKVIKKKKSLFEIKYTLKNSETLVISDTGGR